MTSPSTAVTQQAGANRSGAAATPSMRSALRVMLHHGAMYWLALALGRFSSILLFPLYVRYLTPSDYGVMELLDLTCAVAVTLLGIRLADSMLCHYFDAGAPKDRAAVLSTALFGSLLVGAATALLGWVVAPLVSGLVFRSAQYAYYLRLMFLSVGLSVPQSLGYAFLRAQNRSHLFLGLSVGRLVLQVSLILWLLVVQHLGFAAMVWTALVTYAIEAVFSCWYITRGISITFQWKLFRKLGRYGAPLAVGSIGMLVLHFGDRYVLSRYVTLSEIGIYALGYKIGMLVSYAQGGFAQYWSAQMFPLLQRPDSAKLYVRVSTYYTVALIFVGLVLAVFSRPVLALIVTPAYYPAAAFVPVIALAYVLRGVGDHLRTVFFVEKRTELDAAVISCGVAVCIVLYAVLIPRMGARGAAVATVTAFGVMVPLSFWWAQRIRRYSFEWSRIGVASVCAAGLYAVDQMLIVRRLGPGLFVAALCCLAFPVLLVAVRFFDSAEKLVVRQTWITIVRRFKSVPQGCSGR
jgi:O-antigen/teichoic acid export membrane protein